MRISHLILILVVPAYGTVIGIDSLPPVFPTDEAGVGSENTKTEKPIVNVRTDVGRYIEGQVPAIVGSVTNVELEEFPARVNIQIKNGSQTLHQGSLATAGKNFRYTDLTTEKSGDYTVSVNATSKEGTGYSTTSFEMRHFLDTKVGCGILLTIISLIGLLVFIIWHISTTPDISKVEPIRFALVTTVSLIPLVTMVAADVQLGQGSPVGMVVQESGGTPLDELIDVTELSESTRQELKNVTDEQSFEWVLHFGGSVHDNYKEGITIPVYVLAFGFIAGYLRFLHKTQRGWFKERARYEIKRTHSDLDEKDVEDRIRKSFIKAYQGGKKDETENKNQSENSKDEEARYLMKRTVFNNSMQDLSMIFLSPILAVASYLILVQGGVDPVENWATIAVVSFATGLVTTEIIQRLEGFASGVISGIEKEPNVAPKRTSLDILEERLARGEIDEDEFESKSKRLE